MATDCESGATVCLVLNYFLVFILWGLVGYYFLVIHPWFKKHYKWKAMVDSTRGVISALLIQNNYGFFTNDNAFAWTYPTGFNNRFIELYQFSYWRKLGKTRDEMSANLREAGYETVANEQNPVKQYNMLRLRPGESFPYYLVADPRVHLFEKTHKEN